MMSVDQLPPRRARRPADDAKLVQYDQYIDTQIQNTRRAVKAVDWATSLVLLAIGVLAYLLAAAVLDHWIIPGGFSVAMRTALFVVLLGSVGYFAYRRLWPLCRRAINPVYAAQAIEQASPTLKNSLINLLLFRQHRAEISDAVYQTLEEQAAHGLTRAPVDAAVDRTALIRIGYVLLAVVSLAALYKVLSPKDPLVAAERVLLPWSDIVPASRVAISEITPGSITVSLGEFVDVSADVRGIDDDDAVLLRYTTADGQAVDKPIEMKLARDGLRFEGRLPYEAAVTGRVGLAQNVRYRIEAGDARSLDYDVTVVPAPSIAVERVEYDYPNYTRYLDRHAEGLGDIRAIEGTRVTIQARTNGPIKEAHVDFDADGRRDVLMTGAGAEARASFVLELREDRQTPRHASYVLRFTNAEGRTNREPVKYPITVEPDLAPEAAILRPQEKSLDVRLNDTVAIEAEARDPDFALAEVRLRGEVAGRPVIDEPLLAGKHAGRFTGRYQFTPSAHELRAGDVVTYWVVANDNRMPTANVAESERKQLQITSPDLAKQPPPDRIAQNDRRRQRNQQQPDQQQQRDRQQQQQDGGQQGEGQQGGDQQQGAGQQGEGQQGEGQQGEGQQGERQQGEGQQGRGEQQLQDGGKGGNEAQPSGDQGQSSNGSEDAQAREQGNSREQNPNDKQTGAGAAGGESSQDGSQPDGTRPDGNNTAQRSNGERQNRGDQRQPNDEPAPVSSEGDNDAEAFERIQRHMNQKGELNDGESLQSPQSPQDGDEISRDAQQSAEQGQGDKETGRQEDGQEPGSDGGEDAPARSDSDQRKEPGRDGEPTSVGGQQDDKRSEGTGAETKPGDAAEQKPEPRDNGEQTQAPGGQQTNSKGPSGAGDEQQSKGAPNAQPEMKPAEKRQQSASEGEQTDEQEPSAGARGKRESDSQGEQGGDKAGGGEEGGGQKAPRDGTGSAGQNQSADEGAGESAEKGAGNNSSNAGQDRAADERTGQPGDEQGRGSSQRDGEGEEPGGADQRQGDKEAGRQGGESQAQENRNGERSANGKSNDGESTSVVGEENPNQRGNGAPTGDGGQTGSEAGSASPSEGVLPEGDPANLEYARKQTDLVLDKLAEQLKRKQVDKNLLEQLGWTDDELRRFVSRWQERKAAAQRSNPAGDAARRELDEALRSLGLRRGQLKQGRVSDDTQRDLRQGFRGAVPLEYQERLRAYNQGVSRARQNGE